MQEQDMSQRLNFMKLSGEVAKKYSDFSNATRECSIERSLRDLVTLRASQLNGCAFCVDMHVKEAALHGEGELRLHHVPVWRESPLFSARERAALAWTEVVTKLPEHGVSDELYQEVRKELSEQELSDLTFVIVAINGWNRASVAFRAEPGGLDRLYGLDKAPVRGRAG
jgi:AhpD family alkylhydroperoxidase